MESMRSFKEYLVENIKPQLEVLVRQLENKYNISLDIFYNSKHNSLTLSKIIVNKEQRDTGIGSKAMTDLTNFADKNNLIITLTPSKDFGGAVSRLKSFYKRFGFVENKGRNKDFTFTESMLRLPKNT